MVGFHRTFSTLLHLWEIAEILQVFAKFGPDSKKSRAQGIAVLPVHTDTCQTADLCPDGC